VRLALAFACGANGGLGACGEVLSRRWTAGRLGLCSVRANAGRAACRRRRIELAF
jgi:hypothetical protein